MAIFQDSRYEAADIVPVQDAQGVWHATILPLVAAGEPTAFDSYRVVQGDRFDTIAVAAYGDPELWWQIADANPDVFYPDDLVVGTVLKIPRLQELR